MSQGKKILIVEDDESARFLYREVLELEGFTVLESLSGGEALAHLEREDKIHLIVLDLTLQGMNSTEFMQRLRNLSYGKEIPVLMISGWQDVAEKAKTLGAQGSLRKPVDLDEFEAAVKKLIS